jgi:hypothetical protein
MRNEEARHCCCVLEKLHALVLPVSKLVRSGARSDRSLLESHFYKHTVSTLSCQLHVWQRGVYKKDTRLLAPACAHMHARMQAPKDTQIDRPGYPSSTAYIYGLYTNKTYEAYRLAYCYAWQRAESAGANVCKFIDLVVRKGTSLQFWLEPSHGEPAKQRHNGNDRPGTFMSQ